MENEDLSDVNFSGSNIANLNFTGATMTDVVSSNCVPENYEFLAAGNKKYKIIKGYIVGPNVSLKNANCLSYGPSM